MCLVSTVRTSTGLVRKGSCSPKFDLQTPEFKHVAFMEMSSEGSFIQPAILLFDGHYDHWNMLMEILRLKEYWSLVEHRAWGASSGSSCDRGATKSLVELKLNWILRWGTAFPINWQAFLKLYWKGVLGWSAQFVNLWDILKFWECR